jgi:hypothetical protein
VWVIRENLQVPTASRFLSVEWTPRYQIAAGFAAMVDQYEDYHTRNSSREQTVHSTGKPSPHGLLNAVWFCGLVPAGTW